MNRKLSVTPRSFLNVIAALAGLGLLIALVFSLNALLASRSQTAKQSQTSPSQQSSPTPTTDIDQDDPMTGWKRYTDIEKGLSLKYPPDWQLRFLPSEPGGKLVLPEFYKTSSSGLYSIFFAVHDNQDHLTLQKWVTKNVIEKAIPQYNPDIKRTTLSSDGGQLEAVSGAYYPAASDSLHLYLDTSKDKVVELSLWPYLEDQFATEVDEQAQTTLYRMAESVRPSP